MAFSKVKVGGLADDSVTAANIDDDGTGYTVGNLTNSGTLQQTGQVTLGSGGTNWTLPTARGTDKYVLQINGTTGASTWEESLTAPELSGHNFDVSGSTDDGGINAYEAPYTATGNTTDGSNSIASISVTSSGDDINDLKVGQFVSGTGIPANTVIKAISGTTITLKDNTTGADTNATATNTGTALSIQKTPGEKNGGKVTLSGTNFGATIGEITVAITNSAGSVIANASYLSGLSGGNTITAEWTGTEGTYSTALTSSYTGKVYFKMTKSGLSSNILDSGTTLTSDATLSTPTQTGGDRSAAPSSISLGTYGSGKVAGGGQDSNTKVLLNFDRGGGTDFEDSSNTGGDGHKVTASGHAVIKASPFGDGKSAMYFDGSTHYLSIPASSDLAFGTGDFTIEAWVYSTDWSHAAYINLLDFRDGDQVTNAFWLGFEGNDGSATDGRLYMYHNGTKHLDSANAVFPTYEWHHLAVTRVGATITAYVDGVATGTTYNIGSTDLSAQNTVWIGRYFSGNQYHFKGYLDEIRIVKGLAVYTGNFTVPTSRLSTTWAANPYGGSNTVANSTAANTKLLIHSNKVEDLKRPNRSVLTVGSGGEMRHANSANTIAAVPTGLNDGGYWGNGGATHGVTISDDSQTGMFGITTGNFTIDFWIRVHGTQSSGSRFFNGDSSDGLNLALWMNNTRGLRLYWHESSGWDIFSNEGLATLSDGVWHHCCLARKNDSKITFYLDGILTYANTTSSKYQASLPSDFGNVLLLRNNLSTPSEFTLGTIKNVRVSSNYRPEQSGDPCFVASTAGTTTSGSSIGDGNSFAAFNKSSSTSMANFIYSGDGTSSSRGDGVDDYTKCYVPLDNSITTDSATSGTTHTITTTGTYHNQTHGGIAPALTFPASGKLTGSAGVYFDGSSDYIEVLPTPANMVDNSADTTIEFWFYYKPVTANASLVRSKTCDSTSVDQNFRFYLNTSGGLTAFHLNGTGYVSGNSTYHVSNFQTTYGPNQWWHWACVHDRSEGAMKLYINGKYVASGNEANQNSWGAQLTHSNAGLTFGGGANKEGSLDGYIDQIRISDTIRYSGTDTSTFWSTTNGFSGSAPTKAYGAFGSEKPDVGTITLTATGSGDYTWSEVAGGTALPGTIAVGSTTHSGSGDSRTHTATITGAFTSEVASDTTTNGILIKAQNDADATKAITLGSSGGYDGVNIIQKSTGRPTLFNGRRYVGTGATRNINGLGFRPDLVWIKNRDATKHHRIVDSVRGSSKHLIANETNAESTQTTMVTALNSDGFSVGSSDNVNSNTEGMIAWAWKAGGAPSATGRSAKFQNGISSEDTISTTFNTGTDSYNTASGHVTSITRSVSVDGGFSIVKYVNNGAGANRAIPHGLGSKPEMVILKPIGVTGEWLVYHKGLNTNNNADLNNKFISLQGTGAETSLPGSGGAATNYHFYTPNNNSYDTNTTNSDGVIAYCWKSVPGVSAFGYHQGTISSVSGTQVGANGYCGFKPRIVIIRCFDTTEYWVMFDKFRETTDTFGNYLFANTTAAEAASSGITVTVTDTGFTTGTASGVGSGSQKYISMAFA